MTVHTEKVYMEIHTRVLRVHRELADLETWLKEQRGIKRYCAEHPEAHRRSLELLDQAKRALVAVPSTFMEGGAAIVR